MFIHRESNEGGGSAVFHFGSHFLVLVVQLKCLITIETTRIDKWFKNAYGNLSNYLVFTKPTEMKQDFIICKCKFYTLQSIHRPWIWPTLATHIYIKQLIIVLLVRTNQDTKLSAIALNSIWSHSCIAMVK